MNTQLKIAIAKGFAFDELRNSEITTKAKVWDWCIQHNCVDKYLKKADDTIVLIEKVNAIT